MTFHNVTLAMDLSLSSPGFAVVAVTNEGRPLLLEVSHVRTDGKKSHGYRLGQIGGEIDRYITQYDPEYIVREKGFSRFPATTQALFKVVGVSDLYAWMRVEKDIAEIAPTSVKKLVTGGGKATKKDVEQAVIKRIQIDKPDFFANDDESDAAAVGLAYLIREGHVKEVGLAYGNTCGSH